MTTYHRYPDLTVAVYPEYLVCDHLAGKNFMRDAIKAHAPTRLVQLWECELRHNPRVLQKLIAHAAGSNTAERIGARKCTVDMAVDWGVAKRFFEEHHPQGATASLHSVVGLRYMGELVAAMSFSMSADRRGTATNSFVGASLTRYATSRPVPGGASRLLNAWRDANPGVAIMSYSDPRMFTGDLYRTLGFTLVKVGQPDYLVYVPQTDDLRHKSAFQRKNIERWRKLLGRDDIAPYDHTTDRRTEFEMEDALGVMRLYHAGLLRWELPA